MLLVNDCNINCDGKVVYKSSERTSHKRSEFRCEDKQKPINKQNLLLMSLGVLALMGTVGFAISRKKSDKLSDDMLLVNKKMGELFGRNFSEKETKDFVKRYKSIINKDFNDDYYKLLFNELKKDYKYENQNMDLKLLKDSRRKNSQNVQIMYTEALCRHVGVYKNNVTTKKQAFKSLFHESVHVKQNEMMYRTDKKKLALIKVNEFEKSNNESYKNLLRNCNNDKIAARNHIHRYVKNVYSTNWGHLKPYSKDSEEYKKGLKYLYNEEHRISGYENPIEKYRSQILEKEAYDAGDKAGELYDLICKLDN